VLEGDDPRGGAFALFFHPHPGVFRQLMCPHPRELAHFLKKCLCPGVSPGWGGGWALLELTDALYQAKECFNLLRQSFVKDKWVLSTIVDDFTCISFTFSVFWVPKTQGIWVRGYPKHRDTEITVTPECLVEWKNLLPDLPANKEYFGAKISKQNVG